MTKKEKVIKKLVRAAKKAMKELQWAQPCTPLGDVWNECHKAVEAAKRLK